MFLLLCLAAGVSAYRQLWVLTSAQTPAEVRDLLSTEDSWLPTDLRVLHTEATDIRSLATATTLALAVIDATFQEVDRDAIYSVCSELQIPQIAIGYSRDCEFPLLYTVSPSYAQLAQALQSLSVSFNWTRISLVADSSPVSTTLSSALKQSVSPVFDAVNFYLQDDISIDRVVGRSLRQMGNRVTAFTTQAELAKKIENSQRKKEIAGAGFANLLLLNSAISTQWITGDGDLVLVEDGMEHVSGAAEFYRRLLETVGKLATNCSDSQSLIQRLQHSYPSHFPPQVFSLVNIQSGRRVTVGRLVGGQLTLNSTLRFLGNSSIVPQNLKSPLQISGNFGIRNANNVVLPPQNYYRGAMLAIRDVNEREDVLANFEIDLFNFTAGVQVWNYTFAYQNVYPHRDQLGLALLTSSSSALTIQLYSFLKELNYTGAVIGASNTVDALSSRSNFPSFLRTILPDKFLTKVYIQMFKHFGWTKCALFVSNEIWGLGFRDEFTSLAQDFKIEIINSPQYQVLPTPIPTIDTLHNYTDNFIDFLNCKAKVLLIVVNNNAVFVIDYLYELGVRGGEIQIVANEWLSMSFITTSDVEVNKRRSEILRGAIQFSPLGFLDDFGKKVKEDFIKQYGITPPLYACFYYDALLTIAYGLDTAIALGDEYMDPDVMQRALRGEKFKGCTGTVVFDSETNDRTIMEYNIMNAQFGSNGTVIESIVPVGTYDPTSSVLFHFYADIIWSDGTTDIPEDLRKSSIGCPFEDKYNLEFEEGRNLTYELSGAYFTLLLLFTVFVWATWWRYPHHPLSEKREMQLLDAIVYLGLLLETLQYLSLGPILPFLPNAITLVIDGSAMDIQTVISYKNGGYGIVWLTAFVVFLMWAIMSLVVIFRLDRMCPRVPGVSVIGDVSEALLPIISDYFFVPMLAIMASAYTCVHGVGVASVSYLDSYLEFDCFLDCWQSTHLLYVVGSSVALCVFTPVCVFTRPLWQEMQQHINIKSNGSYQMVKSMVQVTAVLLTKTIRTAYPLAHSACFLSIFVGFALFCWWKAPFGYRRASLWQHLSIVAVIWAAVLATISKSTKAESVVLLSLLLFGWVIIAITGYLYQKFKVPSLLYSKEGVDLNWLFRFAFKPTTIDIMKALKDSFLKVGHRNTIIIPEGTITTDRRDITAAEEPVDSTTPQSKESQDRSSS